MSKYILCTICARKGSKGIKGKNLRLVKGKPLIYHSIRQALNSDLFKKVVISTDSKKIKKLAIKYGAEGWFLRPKKLASSYASKLDVVRHCLKESEKKFNCRFDIIIDLDVTSPLRKISDIKRSLKLLYKKKASNLVSATISRKNPYFNIVEFDKKRGLGVKTAKKLINPILRRQSAPVTYDLNASIYIWRRNHLLTKKRLLNKNTALFIMPPERSIDIDDAFDLKIVERLKNEN